MLKSSVLKIIQSFSPKEITEFNDFLKSPYFNKKSGVVKLYNEIKKYYPDFTNENLEYEKLWSKLYPGKKYGYGVMKNLIFDITKHAEQFITHQEYKSDELQEFANLYRSINNRKLKVLLDNKNTYLDKKFNDEGAMNTSTNLWSYYNLLTGIYSLKIWNNHFYNFKLSLEEDRIQNEENYIVNIITQLVSISCTSTILSKMGNEKNKTKGIVELFLKDIPFETFETVIEKIKERSKIKYSFLNSYYLALKASKNFNEKDDYLKFKNFFMKNSEYMPFSSKKDLITLMENIIYFADEKTYKKEHEFYDIYLFKHKTNTFLSNNERINSTYFCGWANILFNHNNLTELEKYISFYKKYLIVIEKEPSIMYTDAMISFIQCDFNKSLNILSKIKFGAFSLNTGVKKFTLMVYYELNDYVSFLREYDSLKHFISYHTHHQDSPKKIEHNDLSVKSTNEFRKNICTLFKIREGQDPIEIKIFEKMINDSNWNFKNWFLRKINELKKSKVKLSA